MRRVVLISLLLCACGLTARGTKAGDAGDEDAGVDASVTNDGGPGRVEPDAAVDAEVDAAPCEVTVEDTFATVGFDPARWTKTANLANAQLGYPKPVVAGSTPTAKFLEDTTDQVSAGLWHTQVVPFEAFDISFDAYAVCNTGSCGDGLAIAWLAEATASQLADAGQGSALGIPKNLAGAAVALDLADNADRGETEAPAAIVLDIDGSDPTTAYDWVTGTSETLSALVNNGAKRIDISMRAKVVKLRVDGVEKVTGPVTHLPAQGMFGFTAASGAFNAQLAIGDVKATFYRCNAP